MCGIAGYAGSGERATLDRMCTVLAHRGPDDHGVWQQGMAGLAHTRLAIIDPSSLGHQPMVNDAGTLAISFNGEIYNYRELRQDLKAKGAVFHTETDTEVILRMYEKEGAMCFEKLVGQFAIALYDATKKELVLARDLFGEKPLYYAQVEDALVFGSELKALFAHPRVKREVDRESLAHYLAREYVPAPRTIYRGIRKLLPGHLLRYTNGQITIERFTSLSAEETPINDSDALKRFDTLLGAAVKRQLVADVPLGVFLSGGLDSSTIAYYAQQAVGKDLNTFSIGFEEMEFDESSDARLVAAHLGTQHHEEILSAKDALALVREIPEVFDEPVADASVLPTMLLARFAKNQVKVALGGDGADELLLGYSTFKAEQYAELWGRVPIALRALGKGIADSLPTSHGYFSLDFKARSFIDGFSADPFARHLEWLGAFHNEEVTQELITAVRAECPDLTGLNALSHLYLRTYLQDDILAKVDRASMHYALEVRAPFLDPALADFLLSLPASYKYKNGKGKWLLKELMRERLPEEIINKKKQGFAPPIAQWLRGPLRPLLEEQLDPQRLKREGFLDPALAARLMQEHFSGVRDHRKQLWTLLTFQLWHERWMP